MLLHVHVPKHWQKHLKVWKLHTQIKILTTCFTASLPVFLFLNIGYKILHNGHFCNLGISLFMHAFCHMCVWKFSWKGWTSIYNLFSTFLTAWCLSQLWEGKMRWMVWSRYVPIFILLLYIRLSLIIKLKLP